MTAEEIASQRKDDIDNDNESTRTKKQLNKLRQKQSWWGKHQKLLEINCWQQH